MRIAHLLSLLPTLAPSSPMFGSILLKGGKIISAGYDHHRTRYDGKNVRTQGHRRLVSMYAEMRAILT